MIMNVIKMNDFRKKLFDKSDIYTRLNAFSYTPDLIKALQPKIDITKELINLIYDINNVLDALVKKVNIFLSKEIQAEKSLKLFQPNYTRKPSRATINKEIKRMRNIIDTYKINDKLISEITGRGLFSDLPIKASDIKKVENDMLGIGSIINKTIERLNRITQGIIGLERDSRILYKCEVKKLINNLIKSEELINKLLDNFLKQNDNFDENVFKLKQPKKEFPTLADKSTYTPISKKELPTLADKTKSEYSLVITPLSKRLSEDVSSLTKSEQRKQISDYFLRFSQPTKKELKEIRTYIYITDKIKDRNELNEVDGFNIRFDKFINVPLLMHALNYNMDNNGIMKFLKGYNKLINDINHVIDKYTNDAYKVSSDTKRSLVSSDLSDIQKKYYKTYYRLQPLTAKMRIVDVSSADGRIMRDMFKELNILLDKFIEKYDYYGLPSITSKPQADKLINKYLNKLNSANASAIKKLMDAYEVSSDKSNISKRAFVISNAKKAVAIPIIEKQQAVVKQLKPSLQASISKKLTKGKLVNAKLADKLAITKPPVKPVPSIPIKPTNKNSQAVVAETSANRLQAIADASAAEKLNRDRSSQYNELVDNYKQYKNGLRKMNDILFNAIISGEVYPPNDIKRMITFFTNISKNMNLIEKNIKDNFTDFLLNVKTDKVSSVRKISTDDFNFLADDGRDVRDSIYGLLNRMISFLPANKQNQVKILRKHMHDAETTLEW